MKKCPSCQRTFEDNLRFCQVDGTPLVDDAPAFDPYATIVSPGLGGALKPEPEATPAADDQDNKSTSSAAIHEPDDVLEVPQSDPLKTMYASDAEMNEILGRSDPAKRNEPAEEPAISAATPEPEPTAPERPSPSFADMSPPPSPFSPSSSGAPELDPVAAPVGSDLSGAREPAFDEAATIIQPIAPAGMSAEPAAPVQEWTPPPAPEPAWQDQQIGSNTPFETPPAGAAGQSQGLAIASLICGILSLLCCNWFVVGLAAVIMGFIARNKAKSDPANYTGAGLALGGLITGGISLLLGIVFWILYLLGVVASVMNR